RRWQKLCACRRLPWPAIGEWRKSGCAARSVRARSMQPERWSQIDSIFQSALDCAPADRPAFLPAACAGDTALRTEAESLLALHGKTGLTSLAVQEGIQLLGAHSSRLLEGRMVGAYRVQREIGRGGMGTVYLASRADDAFEKLVAIKMVRGTLGAV